MTGTLLAFVVRLATGVRITPEAEDPSPRVYFSNHSSHLDALVIWAALPGHVRRRTRPVAAAEYWSRGPLRRWLSGRVFHAVLIPRDPAHMKSADPLGSMLAALDAGSNLIVFPEGTRSETGEIGPFKPGLYHLAQKHPAVPLVPVYLENLNRILPKGEHLPIPLIGQALFGSPLPPITEHEPKADFLKRARHAVIRLAGGNLVPSHE